MSYQEKYLKYKLKYLNLISQVQKGTGRNNNGACSICFEEFDKPNEGTLNELNYMHLDNREHRETRCCHNIFHKACINRWIAEQARNGQESSCPNCRAPLDFVDRHSIRHKVEPLILTPEIRVELQARLGSDRLGELEDEEQARLLRENEELEAENAARDAELAILRARFQQVEGDRREQRREAGVIARERYLNIIDPNPYRNLF